MHTSIFSHRLRAVFHLLNVLLVVSVAAGCSSSRSAYQFRPAATVATQRPVATPDSAQALAAMAKAVLMPASATQLIQPRKQTQKRPPRRIVAQAVKQAKAQQKQLLAQPTRQQETTKVASPQRPAEVGLGTTVLGVLGLVVLPISLLGLLIWGGPVWAVLAGLAALAVLIAYLDPFG